jgi:hypothetical protein
MSLFIITSLIFSIKQRIKSIVNTFTYERKQKLIWNTEILICSFVLRKKFNKQYLKTFIFPIFFSLLIDYYIQTIEFRVENTL